MDSLCLKAIAARWFGESLLCEPFVPGVQVGKLPAGTLVVCKMDNFPPHSHGTLFSHQPHYLSCYPSESCRLDQYDKLGDPTGVRRAGAEGCEGEMVPSFAFSCGLFSPPVSLSSPGQEMAVAVWGGWERVLRGAFPRFGQLCSASVG